MTKRFRLNAGCIRFGIVALFCLMAAVKISAQETELGAISPSTRGDANAPVTIEIFNDYQCPPCWSMNEELKKVEAKYSGKVRFVFRNFPLKNLHKNALAAAQAAEAAGLQGKFWKMLNVLYERQRQWSDDKEAPLAFVSYAKELGLDVERFESDMKSEMVATRINLDIERARSLRITGTPTLFINGKQQPESLTIKGLLKAVKSALENS